MICHTKGLQFGSAGVLICQFIQNLMMNTMEKDKAYQFPPLSERVEADSLHKHVEEVRLEGERQRREEKRHAEEMRRNAYFEFLNREFSEADRLHIRDLTRAAVHAGELEVQILRFPASYLEDKGRAINNAEKGWQASLTGYAASCYAAYKDIAQPLGYQLVARVLSYPNGMIGDIGIYLKW